MGDYILRRDGSVQREADGAFIPADESNADYAAYLAWIAAGNAADPEPVPPVPRIRDIPPLSFRRRFSATERAMIAIASVQAMLATPPDPTLYVMLDDAGAASTISLDDPLLSAGLDLMISRGLLAGDRKPVLLADVQPGELAGA